MNNLEQILVPFYFIFWMHIDDPFDPWLRERFKVSGTVYEGKQQVRADRCENSSVCKYNGPPPRGWSYSILIVCLSNLSPNEIVYLLCPLCILGFFLCKLQLKIPARTCVSPSVLAPQQELDCQPGHLSLAQDHFQCLLQLSNSVSSSLTSFDLQKGSSRSIA
jgi:hypothetical protein